MKQITILFTLFAFTFYGYSQQEVVQDFESSPSVTGFEGLGSAAVVADPTGAGYGQVFELITSTGGNPWQGAEVILDDQSLLELTSDKTMSVDVYSTVAFTPMAKVEGVGVPAAANTQAHTGSGWETLTYTFTTGSDGTSTADGVYNKAVFFPNRNAADDGWRSPIIDVTVLFDNITGVKTTAGGGGNDNPPTNAAPTPPSLPDGAVISLYSNAFTDITVDAWSAPWDDSDVEDVVVAGDDVKKITFTNFLGVDFATNPFDASEMTHFHMDYWTDETDLTGKVLNPKWSNHQGGNGETNAFDLTNPVPAGSTEQWVSVDVPLSDFAEVNGGDKSAFAQFLLTSNLGVVYVDNIYLYNDNFSNDSFTENQFEIYPNPATDFWTISSGNSVINEVQIYNLAGKRVKTINNVDQASVNVNADGISPGIYFAKIIAEASIQTLKLIKK
jgi:hypothetical protein